MRRYLVFAIVLVAALAVFVPVEMAQGAAKVPAMSSISHGDPVLDNFAISEMSAAFTGPKLSLAVNLQNDNLFYVMHYRNGVTVRVTLYLPSGAHIVASRIKLLVPAGVPVQFKPKQADLHYRMVADAKGVSRPVWIYHHLTQDMPVWLFTVNVPATLSKVCLGAVAVVMGVPGAPVQKAHSCFTRQG